MRSWLAGLWIVAVSFGASSVAPAAAAVAGLDAALRHAQQISFDRSESPGRFGPARYAPGRQGAEAASLSPEAEPTTLRLREPMLASEGTIAFWFKGSHRPTGSQPLLTLRWNANPESYLAISQGWWEPLGARRFYFIVSNQEQMHCSVEQSLNDTQWHFIAVTWRSGRPGHCRLFLDGEKIAEHSAEYRGGYSSSGPISLGSDLASTDRRGRRTRGSMDDLLLMRTALSESAVRALHERQIGGARAAANAQWGWLSDELARSKAPDVAAGARVVFDESWQWARSSRDVADTIRKVRDAGFNVLIPCVWHGAGAYYPTLTAHIDPRLKAVIDDGFDPLAELIKAARAAGVEVHPWFTVTRREDAARPQFFAPGVPAGAYDVQDPAFRDWIVALIADVAVRYDIDGVNLDYIRSMGVCGSSVCRERYRRQTGQDLDADLHAANRDPLARRRVQQWQDAAVGDIVRRVAERVRQAKPGALISVDGFAVVDDGQRPLEGRDELGWLQRGWVDVVFHMDYRSRVDLATLDRAARTLDDPRRLVLLYSTFDRIDARPEPRPDTIVADLARLSLQRSDGAAVYLLGALTPEQGEALRRGPFATPVHPWWHMSFR